MAFTLPDLPYASDALEPHIDKTTMEIHHGTHHAGYVNNLNKAIEGTPLADKSLEDILAQVSKHPAAVRNNAGGHYNHSLFWEQLGPQAGGAPSGELADAIEQNRLSKIREQRADYRPPMDVELACVSAIELRDSQP